MRDKRKTRKKTRYIGVIITFATILSLVTLMNTYMVFRMTSGQTMDEGEYQIKSISGELEGTINESKNQALEIAVEVKAYIDNMDRLSDYIVNRKKELKEETDGLCYNLYIAGTGWDIIPDLEKIEGFVATERTWYKGAIENKGMPFVTSPYVDAWTGDICYSVAIELGDGDTVIGVDYTIDNIQKYIQQISTSGIQNAVIVTEDGYIAGYSDEEKIGKKLTDVIPEYNGVLAKVAHSDGVIVVKMKTGIISDYVFATRTSSGMYLLVKENAWELYRDSYIQLFITVILSIAIFVIIISLYLITKRNQERAEEALEAKDEFLAHISKELQSPLKSIANSASIEELGSSDYFEQEIDKIREASIKLSDTLDQITSYSNIVRSEKHEQIKTSRFDKQISLRYRNIILATIVIVATISCYLSVSTTYRLGQASMKAEVQNYQDQLSSWINTQKSILDMFCSVISTNPEMLKDYDGTIHYLDRITKQYPEISVTYMTNPEFEHTVMMNNGWEPDDDWHVEERQWYLDTMASESGWSISAPYYDEQTGLYCITMSESVYDDKTGDFLGNFGIDFYMDKLIDILGASYQDDGYAFLVDAQGEIINHPYGSYQMSEDTIVNVNDIEYSDATLDAENPSVIKDYDGNKKLVLASADAVSGFSIYVVSSIWKIFGRVLAYSALCIVLFVGCVVLIFSFVTRLIVWQEKVNSELKETADVAIAAGKAKSQFLAQMSHEIRTPINAVLGMNEMILRESENINITEYATNIKGAGTTLLALINSILDFSKIEDGKMEIIPVDYDTASMINDLVNAISERATAKGLTFDVDIDEKLPVTLHGDDVRMRQVITNLLTNAVKYTETGSVKLGIRTLLRDRDNIALRVEVQDTGIGIREEDREKLFESFQRLEEKRNRNIEGTGLGISIVTKLLNMMDSSLEVESVYGAGSTFGFTMMQKVVDDTPIGKYKSRLDQSRQSGSGEAFLYVPDAKILVVDDSEMNLKVASGLMKRNGFIPDLAHSGFEAIEYVKSKKYDIVFLDHMMPKLDGIETLQQMLQQNIVPKETVVIVLTANAIVGAKDEYLKAGFDDYLAKPIDVAQLEKMMAKYLPESKVSYKKKDGNASDIKENANSNDIEKVEQSSQENAAEIKTEVGGDPVQSDEKPIDRLAKGCPDIDVQAGLKYCMNDEEFYLSIVEEYITGNKIELLNRYFEEKNYDEYRVAIHALKSTSLTVGLTGLSERAKQLEFAVKDGDIAYIESNHADFMNDYEHILDRLKELMGM